MKSISERQKDNASSEEKRKKEYKPSFIRDGHEGFKPKPAGESTKRWNAHFKPNAAQKAMSKVLGNAGKEVTRHKRKEGEAPLEHLKRLTK